MANNRDLFSLSFLWSQNGQCNVAPEFRPYPLLLLFRETLVANPGFLANVRRRSSEASVAIKMSDRRKSLVLLLPTLFVATETHLAQQHKVLRETGTRGSL